MFKEAFGDNLEIKVLFPIQEEIIKRDRERECWTTGIDRISSVYNEFEAIKDKIGGNNYINTTNQTPIDTFDKYFSHYSC